MRGSSILSGGANRPCASSVARRQIAFGTCFTHLRQLPYTYFGSCLTLRRNEGDERGGAEVQAVLAVISDGRMVKEVAREWGVSRQTLHVSSQPGASLSSGHRGCPSAGRRSDGDRDQASKPKRVRT